ncbi:TetR family transcriptional regulator C-terminal domain-containing protein, partial [Paenibacillus agri]|uniref:TetR family transcriptional regulator C-terminal domain-containing protein n=1 Tax=Paenibacillus agri TaxID=2744309 RepID=UPI0035E3FCF7
DGIKAGEFRGDLDSDALASFAFSLLEGGILLSKLDGDNKHMQINTACFASYLQNCCLKTSTDQNVTRI